MNEASKTQRMKLNPDKELMDHLDGCVTRWYQETDCVKRFDYVLQMYELIEHSGVVDTAKYHLYVQNRMYND